MNLVLRPSIIADDKLPNDYCVIHEGRSRASFRAAWEQFYAESWHRTEDLGKAYASWLKK